MSCYQPSAPLVYVETQCEAWMTKEPASCSAALPQVRASACALNALTQDVIVNGDDLPVSQRMFCCWQKIDMCRVR